MNSFSFTRALVRKILEHAQQYDWTLQGFGMLRLNLEKVGRIHVWDDRFAVPNVSTIHTHPWDLHSLIISGCLRNYRYGEYSLISGLRGRSPTHMRQSIATGEGGGLRGEPQPVFLVQHPGEVHRTGMEYQQFGEEIHESVPNRGCVTLLKRPKGQPLELAHVYWPHGKAWVSAEPRPATKDEIEAIVSNALAEWEVWP